MAATQEDARQVESLGKGDTLKKPSAIRKKAPPKLAKLDKKEKGDKPTLDEKPEKKLETENVGDVGAGKTPEAGLEEQVGKVEEKAGEAGEEAEEELENEDMENEEEGEEELEQQRGPVEQREAMPSDTAAGSSSTAGLADKGKGAAVQLGRIGEGTESMKDQVPAEMPDQVQEKAGEGVQEPTEGVVEPEKETDLGDGIPEPPDVSEVKEAAVSIGDLKGLSVGEGGNIVNAEGKTIGKVVEGDPDDLVGQVVDADGEILDEDGDLIGRVDVVTEKVDELPQADELPKAEELPEAEEVAELPQLPDISTLEGLKCTKFGSILDTQGNLVGELVEGDAKRIFRGGFELDDKGQFWDHRGNVIGKVQPVLPEAEETSIFEGMKDLYVDKEGWVLDDNGQRVGQVVEGDVKKLAGRAVDEDGDILDRHGNLLGHAEPWQEPEEVADEVTEEKPDLSCLAGLKPTKLGLVIGPDQVPLGRVVEGDPKQLAGRTIAPDGLIWGDNGEVIGQVDLIPENERKDLSRPFQGCTDLMVNGSGWVEDGDGNILGRVIEGDPQKLQGYDVDEDGEIVDQHGTVLGRAAPCEPPAEEVEVPDLSALAGKVVNKMGNVVDTNGVVFGRLVTGNPRKLAGKSVDEQGQVWDAAGHVVGQAELIPDAERERPEGPFSGLDGLTVNKEGQVVDPNGTPVGRLVEGDPKRLAGRAVDDDGEVLDSAGNCIGRAEPWSAPEELPSPMAGRKVNREGEVRDEDGNLIGKLTQGELSNLIGRTIDKDGYVVDSAGNRIGECTLLENIPPEPEPEEPEMSPEEREQLARQEEENELAKKMCSIVQQALDSLEPMCRMITQHIEKANSTPKDELDEEALVKEVKPLIEEAGTILQECKGALRALDPDGHIAANAKARSASQEATPQEHHLAELLKDLTQLVTETIERGKSMIADMPHAKKEINPLWALLSEPLFQIIAAVGLLLSGVLGLVSNLLNGLGLGGLLQGLLGGLGVDKLLEGLGLGTITQGIGLGGKK